MLASASNESLARHCALLLDNLGHDCARAPSAAYPWNPADQIPWLRKSFRLRDRFPFKKLNHFRIDRRSSRSRVTCNR